MGTGMRKKRMPPCNEGDRDCNIIPRESGQTSARSFMTRTLDQTTQKGKQMTVESTPTEQASDEEEATGAPFHGVTDWHAIDWQTAHYNGRRLQARSVKATQEGKWGKVKALQ